MSRRLCFRSMLGIVALGLGLRVLLARDLGFHSDEATFVVTASQPGLAEVWRNSLVNSHPPGHYFLLHGLLGVSWHPLWLKLPSLLAGTGAIALVYFFAARLVGPGAGLVAALLAALSPQLVGLSLTTRNYSVGFLFLLATLVCAGRVLERTAAGRDARQQAALLRALWGLGLFQLLALLWHYGFIAALAGVDAVVLWSLTRVRAPLRVWLHAAAAQLPAVGFCAFAYASHIAAHAVRSREYVNEVFGPYFSLQPVGEHLARLRGVLRPVLGSCEYLAAPWGAALFALALLGALVLAWRRRWWALGLLLAPFPFAYGLMLSGSIPFGELRHSAYLFPFLFGLAGAALELAWQAASSRLRPGLALLACTAGLVFGATSLQRLWEGPVTQGGFIPDINRVTHFETATRRSDLRSLEQALESRSDEGDAVLLSYQSLQTLWIHWALGPLRFDLGEPVDFVHAGRRFHYSPVVGWSFSAGRLLDAIAEIEARRGEPFEGQVWVPTTGWELYSPSLGELLPVLYPRAFPRGRGVVVVRNPSHQVLLSGAAAARLRKLPRLSDRAEFSKNVRYVLERAAQGDD